MVALSRALKVQKHNRKENIIMYTDENPLTLMTENPDQRLLDDLFSWLIHVFEGINGRISQLENAKIELQSSWIMNASTSNKLMILTCQCDLVLPYVIKHTNQDHYRKICTKALEDLAGYKKRIAMLPLLPIYSKLPTVARYISQKKAKDAAIDADVIQGQQS